MCVNNSIIYDVTSSAGWCCCGRKTIKAIFNSFDYYCFEWAWENFACTVCKQISRGKQITCWKFFNMWPHLWIKISWNSDDKINFYHLEDAYKKKLSDIGSIFEKLPANKRFNSIICQVIKVAFCSLFPLAECGQNCEIYLSFTM